MPKYGTKPRPVYLRQVAHYVWRPSGAGLTQSHLHFRRGGHRPDSITCRAAGPGRRAGCRTRDRLERDRLVVAGRWHTLHSRGQLAVHRCARALPHWPDGLLQLQRAAGRSQRDLARHGIAVVAQGLRLVSPMRVQFGRSGRAPRAGDEGGAPREVIDRVRLPRLGDARGGRIDPLKQQHHLL